MKYFYVCSYGGCGSTMLCKSLSKYGKVEHIHSPNPPTELEFVGNKGKVKCYHEWFNGIRIPEKELKNYYVIYIYKNPVKAIISRFHNPTHLKHIQSNESIKIKDVINESKDLFGINNFYNNYTESKKRNYKIYCIKYEELFEKQDELSKIFSIGSLNLEKKEKEREFDKNDYNKLCKIYENLINKMNNNNFIFIS